eukprot:1644319-Pleurochrysis_carterae.AAC.1
MDAWFVTRKQRHPQPIRTGHTGDTPALSSSRRSARSTPGRSDQVRAVRSHAARRVQRTGWVKKTGLIDSGDQPEPALSPEAWLWLVPSLLAAPLPPRASDPRAAR